MVTITITIAVAFAQGIAIAVDIASDIDVAVAIAITIGDGVSFCGATVTASPKTTWAKLTSSMLEPLPNLAISAGFGYPGELTILQAQLLLFTDVHQMCSVV